jgi:hypothetical protein
MISLAHRRKHLQQLIGTEPNDYDAAALRIIANGPICDALRAFCPAGKLTLAQAKAREAAQVRAA